MTKTPAPGESTAVQLTAESAEVNEPCEMMFHSRKRGRTPLHTAPEWSAIRPVGIWDKETHETQLGAVYGRDEQKGRVNMIHI